MALQKITTPIGEFLYPKVFTPDTKFDDDGIHSIGIVLPLEPNRGLVTTFEAALAEAVAEAKKDAEKKGKSPKVKVAEDLPYTVDEEAGTLTIRAKSKAQYKKDDKIIKTQPAVFGPDKQPMKDPGFLVGSGSTGQISFVISPYNVAKLGVGLSFRLNAVIFHTLKAWERTADSFGFEAGPEAASGVEEGTAAEDLPPVGTEGGTKKKAF